MATHYLSIGNDLAPDTSGDVYFNSLKAINASFVWDGLALTFADTSTKIQAGGRFVVPGNYIGSPVVKVVFFSTATSGNVRWEIKYTVMSDGDTLTEAATETVAANQAISGTQWGWSTASLSLTAGNLSAGGRVVFNIARDGSDAGDTMAAAAHLAMIVLEFSD